MNTSSILKTITALISASLAASVVMGGLAGYVNGRRKEQANEDMKRMLDEHTSKERELVNSAEWKDRVKTLSTGPTSAAGNIQHDSTYDPADSISRLHSPRPPGPKPDDKRPTR